MDDQGVDLAGHLVVDLRQSRRLDLVGREDLVGLHRRSRHLVVVVVVDGMVVAAVAAGTEVVVVDGMVAAVVAAGTEVAAVAAGTAAVEGATAGATTAGCNVDRAELGVRTPNSMRQQRPQASMLI